MTKSFSSDLKVKWRQYLYAIYASYGSLCTGMAIAWTSPVLGELRGERSPLPRAPTLTEESWLGSLLVLGSLLGPLITVSLSNRVGRRWLLIGANAPLLLGWLLALVAKNLATLYVARVLWGCASGMLFAMATLYIAEIAEDSNRGALSAFFLVFINVGFLLAYAVGAVADYWGLTATGGVLSLLYVPFTCLLPETPFFLVYKGRFGAASRVLQKLRGTSEDAVQEELSSMKRFIAREFQTQPKISDLWASKGTLKALGICCFLVMLVQMSGISVLLYYMQELLAKVGANVSPSKGAIMIAIVQVVVSCLVPLVVERLGRKFLLWTTSLGLTVFLGIIGLYALLESHFQYDVTSFAFIPLLCLVFYMIFFTLGVGPVPWILTAEMFPVRSKFLASGVASTVSFITGFVWTRYFREVADSYGQYTAFWVLAVCCGFGFVFCLTVLPETKGKTFDEIQDMLENRKKTDADVNTSA